jgi:hypothetical protein
MRRLLGLLAIVGVVLVSGCGPKPTPSQEMKDVFACGVGQLSGPLGASRNVLQTAAKIYDGMQHGATLEAAIRAVYGKDIRNLTPDEQHELALIVTGLDRCAAASPELKSAADGVTDILVSMVSPRSGEARQALPVLCPNEDPYDGEPHRYQPDCGIPTIDGKWTFTRTIQLCVGLPEGCALDPVTVTFGACTDSQCTMIRNGVWKSAPTLQRTDANGWRATFTDIGLVCKQTKPFTYNPAAYTITLRVADIQPGTAPLRAATLTGTWDYAATTNPPCDSGDMRVSYAISGARA